MTYRQHFEALQKHIPNLNKFPLEDMERKQRFQPVLIAAFIKSFEFNLFIQRNRAVRSSFFYTPYLRGLCEDLICLKYIHKHFKNGKEDLILSYMKYLMYTSIQSQMSFLGKAKPFQSFVGLKDIEQRITDSENDLKNLMSANGQSTKKIFPSVEHMAIDSKLKELYDFLYHASSRMVHFSPNVLLRMGWYPKTGKIITFSSKNFHKYYQQFNKVYGAFLFVHFCKTFKEPLKLDAKFMKTVMAIEKQLLHDFFPDLITFEELNLKRPSDFIQTFMRMLAEKKSNL